MRRFAIVAGIIAVIVARSASADDLVPSHIAEPARVVEGQPVETRLAPELAARPVARGILKLENASTSFATYGYAEDHPDVSAPQGGQPLPGQLIEKTKTEPDKNVYLVLDGQTGAEVGYAYGRHFLYQGHEAGPEISGRAVRHGFVTRINLDADEAHRVTLLAEADAEGQPLPPFDGITWNPFSQRLLLTAELGRNGGVWQATLDVPSKVEDISGALGRGGYEGIQADGDGNLWIVEDAYESSPNKEKRPYSYI